MKLPLRILASHWRILVLAALAALRLIAAATIPLSADEAYYRVWAHALAFGYPDHPPMVAIMIRAGIAIAGDTQLGIRLLGPIAALLGSLLLVQAGVYLAESHGATAMQARQAGWRAAWLLNATLLCNAGAVIMTPDTPLLLGWTGCLAAIARAIRTGRASWFLAGGACAGLSMDSKYTAGLLAPALLAWLIAVPEARPLLRRWQPYAGAALAIALFAPVFAWNAAHHWASFARQGGRGQDFHLARAGQYLAELLGAQLGLATPLLAIVFCVGVVRCARNGAWRRPASGLLLAVTALPALVFLQHALGGRVQANWPGVIYPSAALAAALTLVPFWRASALLGAALSVAILLQAAAAPFALPRRLDFTLIRLAGWDDLARAADRARAACGAGFIAADEYGLASELAFHLSAPVLAVGARWSDVALPRAAPGTPSGLLVRSDREAGGPDSAIWPGAAAIGTARRARAGITAETYTLYCVRVPVRAAMALLPPGLAAD
jgi:4-amino-4-deoxy-L-arabinose transferase-like glycosyltransferase